MSTDPADVHVLLTKQYRTRGQTGRTAGWEGKVIETLPMCNAGFPWLPQESSHPSWPGRKEKEADKGFMGHTRSSVVSSLKKTQAKPGTMLHILISLTRRQRQADLNGFEAIPSLHRKSQASQGCIASPCLKDSKQPSCMCPNQVKRRAGDHGFW